MLFFLFFTSVLNGLAQEDTTFLISSPLPKSNLFLSSAQNDLIHKKNALTWSELDDIKDQQIVSSIGASTCGYWVEACVGSAQKGCRHRFHSQTFQSTEGFLGPQSSAKPIILKDQPGIFPAPLMGEASITFTFKSQKSHSILTPIVIRPDGTAFHTLPMTSQNSLQTLVISSPAQTGIYTLFVYSNPNTPTDASISVDALISTQPQNRQTFVLFPFESNGDGANFSAEFIYKK